jgi:hypothetical protein
MELDAWSVVVAAVAVCIAIWGVIVAHRANGRSKEANEISRQSLETQQRSVLPSWSSNESGNRARPVFRNQSSRTIVVERVWAKPGTDAVFFQFVAPLPQRVEYGDVFSAYVSVEGYPVPTHVAIEWRYEDETDTQVSERLL